MQRVTPVPAEVLLLGSGADEQVQPGRADNRAHRVHARSAVAPEVARKAIGRPSSGPAGPGFGVEVPDPSSVRAGLVAAARQILRRYHAADG